VAAEVLHGDIVEKASPTFRHAQAQASIGSDLFGRFGRPPGGGGPGGWWIGTEVEVEYEPTVIFRHDLAGWRRERSSEPPDGFPVALRPDWVCEILSPSNWSHDTVSKLKVLQQAEVPYYWIADVEHGALTVYRWQAGFYVVAVAAKTGDRQPLPPFDQVELDIGSLLGVSDE
jgi:Uma2 family endonuclease